MSLGVGGTLSQGLICIHLDFVLSLMSKIVLDVDNVPRPATGMPLPYVLSFRKYHVV